MTTEEWTEMTQNTYEQRDLNIRQVSNGYSMVGNRRFMDSTTHTQRFGIGVEGVAEQGDHALAMIQRFYTAGDFITA